MQIKESKFRVIVKTKSNSNKLIGFDKEKQAYLLNIKSVPEKGQANKEIIKFLSKLLKKQVRIVRGLKSKDKTIEII
ncbi:hypothetical protein CEE44_01890 [Candidatus Woesearchaeota archaeon B3_Woes]|nr:MAG: hypothetical protein CEE44_01890 [Candidatus Woesearchaeota archaeon B3_Woes]